MKFMLKTLGISLVLAVAGCANNGTSTNPSLSAADDTPACASSCSSACKSQCSSTAKTTSCCGKCDKAKANAKPSLGASDDAPSCSQKASSCCPSAKKKASKSSSLGAFDDTKKTKSSCCPKSGSGGDCPFSGKKN